MVCELDRKTFPIIENTLEPGSVFHEVARAAGAKKTFRKLRFAST
jgi:hypothetical protein